MSGALRIRIGFFAFGAMTAPEERHSHRVVLMRWAPNVSKYFKLGSSSANRGSAPAASDSDEAHATTAQPLPRVRSIDAFMSRLPAGLGQRRASDGALAERRGGGLFRPATPPAPAPAQVNSRIAISLTASATEATDATATPATPHGIFSQDQADKLRNSQKVVVVEYSSTGGGHTDRCLLPVLEARRQGVLAKNDCVVILAPPRWPHDAAAGKVQTMHDRAAEMKEKGLHVFLCQTDRTITGLYEKSGASNNVEMLRDLVYKPQRGPEVPLSVVTGQEVQAGPANSADKILGDVIFALRTGGADGGAGLPRVGAGDEGSAAGKSDEGSASGKGRASSAADRSPARRQALAPEEKILVLGDMAPFLQKAAAKRGIRTRVEIGNHQGLYVGAGREELGRKDLSYLAKASSSGWPSKLALIDYDPDVNVLPTLTNTLNGLGINRDMTPLEARHRVLKHLDENAHKFPLEAEGCFGKDGKRGGIMSNAKPKDIQRMVYVYLNEYTKSVADFVQRELKNNPDWKNTLVAFCDKGAVDKEPKNLLHLMYAANADGITNAGFGTTSEFHYLHKSCGYKGRFIVAPVEHQHEQQANAARMVALCGDDVVRRADDVDDMKEQLQKLIEDRPDDAHLMGAMKRMFDGVQRETRSDGTSVSNVDHIKDLLKTGTPLKQNARDAVEAMNQHEFEFAPKERRRMYKLLVPALDCLRGYDKDGPVNGRSIFLPSPRRAKFTVQATQKHNPRNVSVGAAIRLMKRAAELNDGKALQKLLGMEIRNLTVKQDLARHARSLEEIMSETDATLRARRATEYLENLARQEVALGW